MIRRPPRSTLLPYTTLLRSTSRPCQRAAVAAMAKRAWPVSEPEPDDPASRYRRYSRASAWTVSGASSWSAMLRSRSSRSSERSEEHTSELQSRQYLVCRLLHDTSTTEIYTLALHDAPPIYLAAMPEGRGGGHGQAGLARE